MVFNFMMFPLFPPLIRRLRRNRQNSVSAGRECRSPGSQSTQAAGRESRPIHAGYIGL